MSKFLKFLGMNKPSLMVYLGTGGLITAAVMAYKSAEVVQYRLDAAWDIKISDDPENDDVELTKKEKAWIYVRTLWPAITVGAVSAALILLGNREHLNRHASALAAYYISEKTLRTYQEEVLKEIGEKKERELRDKVAVRKAEEVNPTEKTIVLSEGSNPWICDTATGCFFRMSYEKFRRVIAEANLEMYKRDYISVADLYEMLDVDLPPGGDWFLVGWGSGGGDIEYYMTSTVREIMGEMVPCMVVEYRYKPVYDFNKYG